LSKGQGAGKLFVPFPLILILSHETLKTPLILSHKAAKTSLILNHETLKTSLILSHKNGIVLLKLFIIEVNENETNSMGRIKKSSSREKTSCQLKSKAVPPAVLKV